MRQYKTTALCLLMTALPSMTWAQANVKAAFDKFLKSTKVEYTSKHSLDKDPETNKKEGQMDIYEYTINIKNKSMIKDLQTAFEEDKNDAYTIESGTNSDKGSWEVSLAVGDGTKTSVGLGKNKGEKYLYACFIDPEDKTHAHRYAYGMSWLEQGNYITGRLVVTYATTLKYRQNKASKFHVITTKGHKVTTSGNTIITTIDNSDENKNDTIEWITNFQNYARVMDKNLKNNKNGSSLIVNEIYKMCKNAPKLPNAEKSLVISEIKRLQQMLGDDFQKQLLSISIDSLK